MVGWKQLQSVDDAARALLTHRCRYRPGLKLTLAACESYRSRTKLNPMAPGSTDALLCDQWQCPGPVPLSTETFTHGTAPVEGDGKVETKKYDPPSVCRTCGMEVDSKRDDGSTVAFYPSRPDECIRCILDRRKAREMEVVQAREKRVSEPPKFKFRCEKHGPHNGKVFGRDRVTSICPKCNSEKVSASMRKIKSGITENSMQLPSWLLEWALEKSAEDGITASEYIARKILPDVDAEWLKSFILREGFRGLENNKDNSGKK